MSKEDRIDRLPIEHWQIESLRLTAFPLPASPVEDVDWWEILVGQPPVSKVLRPREQERMAGGPFANGELVNLINPARIDWRLSPSRDQELPMAGFPTIGTFTEIIEPFSQLMNRWLELDSCPDIRRLAFGTVSIYPVESRVAGYRQLSAYLPSVSLDSERSSDFFYQINRTRDSTTGIAGLTINRLSKWSVATMRAGGMMLEPTLITYQQTPQDFFACRLELDVNTLPQRLDLLPRMQTTSVLTELIDLGREIIAEGDIP